MLRLMMFCPVPLQSFTITITDNVNSKRVGHLSLTVTILSFTVNISYCNSEIMIFCDQPKGKLDCLFCPEILNSCTFLKTLYNEKMSPGPFVSLKIGSQKS